MTESLDNLIRAARPALPQGARERALAALKPQGLPWLRLAAAVALAFVLGGVAAAALRRAPAADDTAALAARVQSLEARVQALQAPGLPAPELAAGVAELARGAQALEERRQAAQQAEFRSVVAAALDEYRASREREHMEQHLAHARRHFEAEVNAAVAALKDEHGLTDAQEAEVRRIYAEHGEQALKLVGGHYRGRGRHMNREFETLVAETSRRVREVLDGDAPALPGGTLADWGPSPEFKDWNDYDAWLLWNEQAG